MTWRTGYKLKEKFCVIESPIFGTCPSCKTKNDFTHNKDMTKVICGVCKKEFDVNWVA